MGVRSVDHLLTGKPIPRHIRTNDGYTWQNKEPEQVVRDGGKGAMFPFILEFHHPEDGNREPWGVIQRWQQDAKRFPVGAYAEGNLLWRGRDWCTPTSAERTQAYGCPPAAVRQDHMNNIKSKDAERVANCAVCNGFHIPSMMLVFILLLQSATAWGPTPCTAMRYIQDENMLRRRVQGTVFEPEALLNVPGFLTPDQCTDQMELIFKDLSGDGTCRTAKFPWRTIRSRLRHQEAAVHSLQRFWAHEILRGQEDGPMGPRARSAQETAQAWAYLGMQRAAGRSHRGLDHLLQPGLGRDRHMVTATALPSPYRPMVITTDPDLKFAAYTMAVWGPFIGPWREQQRLLLMGLVGALQPMTEALRRRMPESVKRVVVTRAHRALHSPHPLA